MEKAIRKESGNMVRSLSFSAYYEDLGFRAYLDYLSHVLIGLTKKTFRHATWAFYHLSISLCVRQIKLVTNLDIGTSNGLSFIGLRIQMFN